VLPPYPISTHADPGTHVPVCAEGPMADRRENEGRFMRALCTIVLLAVLSTGVTGCAVFGKKEGSSERHGPFAWFKKKDTSANPPPPKFPDPLTAPASVAPPPGVSPATAQSPAAPEALLSGQVIDARGQPVSNSYIQLVRLDAAREGTPPQDVPTVGDGYFIIQGLKSGGQYQLTARTKRGEKMLAGIKICKAPDPHVVIQVSEDLATSSIPPLPDPGEKKEIKPAATSGLDNRPPATAVWTPAPAGHGTAVDVELPAKLSVPSPSAAPSTLAPGVAAAPNTSWPPMLQMGPKKSPPQPPPVAPQPPVLPPANDQQSKLAPKVPSCVVIADKVQILALKDVDDQTWNFHKDRKGKAVLLDFWMPNCPPCRQMMPALAQMQNKYGPQGLEVVGVYLDSSTVPVHEQAMSAKKTCYSLQTNYRQVLGQDEKTNLRGQFRVRQFPTMILLDAQGRIVWRHDQLVDPAVLEHVLQQHLAPRPF
jgi:thiol-disulfide isomerase/thioredoxin